jgi:hypothetical protein
MGAISKEDFNRFLGALVVWAYQLGRLSVGWLGAIKS